MKSKGRTPPRHKLVAIVAWLMFKRLGGRVSFEELYDLGVPGLAVAHHEWDGKGPFEPFAMARIRWAMIDELRKRRRDPVIMALTAVELSADNHSHTAEELARAGGNVEDAAGESIDEIVDNAGGNLSVDVCGAERVEEDIERIRLRRAVKELPPPQDEVMDRYVYQGETFKEIGEALSLSGAAVFKIHEAAVRTLVRLLGERASPGEPSSPAG